MDNIFVISGIIAFIFLVVKFMEMRVIEKENKPLKLLIRDALVVYFSTLAGFFIIDQLNPVIDATMTPTQPSVFTDNPTF